MIHVVSQEQPGEVELVALHVGRERLDHSIDHQVGVGRAAGGEEVGRRPGSVQDDHAHARRLVLGVWNDLDGDLRVLGGEAIEELALELGAFTGEVVEVGEGHWRSLRGRLPLRRGSGAPAGGRQRQRRKRSTHEQSTAGYSSRHTYTSMAE